MDVDLDNFEEAFALLERYLPLSAFIAIDLEMTGIMGPPSTKVCGGDTPQEQYTKARSVVCRPYNIVQVGICLFQETAPQQFECRPFNFFVFPRPYSEHVDGKHIKVDDHFIGLSSSSVLFLAERGLDLNRWVCKGVGYTNAADEEPLRKALSQQQQESAQGGAESSASSGGRGKPEVTRPADIALVEETMQKVAEFEAAGEPELKLPNMNAFLALVIRQKISEAYPGLVVEKRPGAENPNWQERWVMNLSEEARKEREEQKRRRILSHLGFRRVWTLLREQRRPVVFHNGLFDLLFMSAAFEGTLPRRLEEFKSSCHAQFPVLFDTKVLAESAELSGSIGCSRSALPELALALDTKLAAAGGAGGSGEGETAGAGSEAAKLSFALPEGFQGYSGAEDGAAAFHTAGYDAYQTGKVFAFFRSRLGDMKTLDFMGRVFLMFTAFELRLGHSSDRFMYDGIARHLFDIDTAAVNNKGLLELLKPVLEDGKRKAAFRWCNGNKAMVLVIYGTDDVKAESAEREAIETCLDSLLKKQEEQGRLHFRTLGEHLERVAALHGGAFGAGGGERELSPSAKRRRTD